MDHTIIKDAATKIVANIKAMEDDITVLRNKQDIISTSDTTMTGSYPGRLSIEEIGGKCEQFTTTGKQMINLNDTFNGSPTISDNGYIISHTGQDAWAQRGFIIREVEAGQVWYASAESLSNVITNIGTVAFQQRDADKNILTTSYLTEGKLSINFIIAENAVEFTVLVLANTSSSVLESDNTITVKGLMLSLTEGNEWEPYTGGQPSPNPDYPQEIKKTVVSEIKTHGKNFVPISEYIANASGDTKKYMDIPMLEIGKTYIISGECTDGTKLNSANCQCVWADENSNMLFTSEFVMWNSGATVSADLSLAKSFHIYTVDGLAGKTVRIQIEEGTVATDYEPYTESTITLSQPIELYGIGDVQDTIEDGKVKRKIGKAVFDGSSDEYWYSENNYFRMQGVNTDNTVPILCKHLRQTKIYEEINSVSGTMWVIVNGFSINMTGVCSTVSELRTWLADNQLTIFYGLPTETIEPLPLPDQMALNSLKTYDGVTYVEIDSEIEPTFKAEYGVTKLGGYTLEGILAGANGVSLGQSNTDRITALEATLVNNI